MPNESPLSSDAMIEAMGLHPDTRIWVGGSNKDTRREVERNLSGMSRPPFGSLDAAIITPSTNEEAAYFAVKLKPRLTPDANVWVVVPSTDNSTAESAIDPMSGLISQVIGAGLKLKREMSFRAGLRGIVFSVAGAR